MSSLYHQMPYARGSESKQHILAPTGIGKHWVGIRNGLGAHTFLYEFSLLVATIIAIIVLRRTSAEGLAASAWPIGTTSLLSLANLESAFGDSLSHSSFPFFRKLLESRFGEKFLLLGCRGSQLPYAQRKK